MIIKLARFGMNSLLAAILFTALYLSYLLNSWFAAAVSFILVINLVILYNMNFLVERITTNEKRIFY